MTSTQINTKILINPYALNIASILEIDKQLRDHENMINLLNEGKLKFIKPSPLTNKLKTRNLNLYANYLGRSRIILSLMAFEGFINLITSLFLRKEFQNEAFKRKVDKDNIDLRLLYMHTHCFCFERTPIDIESDLFKAIQHVINIRNDLVHANIESKGKKEKYGVPANVLELNFTHSYNIQDIIRKTVISCLNNMIEDYRYIMTIKHSHLKINYCESNKPNELRIGLDEEDIFRLDAPIMVPLIDSYLNLDISPTGKFVPTFDEYEYDART